MKGPINVLNAMLGWYNTSLYSLIIIYSKSNTLDSLISFEKDLIYTNGNIIAVIVVKYFATNVVDLSQKYPDYVS